MRVYAVFHAIHSHTCMQHMCIFITIFDSWRRKHPISWKRMKNWTILPNETEIYSKISSHLICECSVHVSMCEHHAICVVKFLGTEEERALTHKEWEKMWNENTHKFTEKYKLFKWFVLLFAVLQNDALCTSSPATVVDTDGTSYWGPFQTYKCISKWSEWSFFWENQDLRLKH